MRCATRAHFFLKASGERDLRFPSVGGVGWVLPWSLAPRWGSHLPVKWSILAWVGLGCHMGS